MRFFHDAPVLGPEKVVRDKIVKWFLLYLYVSDKIFSIICVQFGLEWNDMARLRSHKMLRFFYLWNNFNDAVMYRHNTGTAHAISVAVSIWGCDEYQTAMHNICAFYREFIKLFQIRCVCGKSSSHISVRHCRVRFTCAHIMAVTIDLVNI